MDYTTIENKFEGFDASYKLYMLDVLLDYMFASGKNEIKRTDIYKALNTIKQELQQEQDKPQILRKVA